MNKWLKRVLLVLAVLLIFVGAAGLYIQISGIPKYSVEKINYHVDVTPARVVRGKVIASMLCQGCHLNQQTQALTGHRMLDMPPEFGKIYSRNITKDPVHGIGKWSDADLAYFLRTGVKPDGQYVPPYMVKLPHISDEDMASIIAFLRSDDTLVRPMAVKDTECEPSFLVKFLSRVAFKPFKYPTSIQAAPALANKVAYGKYLVHDVLKCYECHSADFKTNNSDQPELSDGYMGGGNGLLDANGKKVYTPNLTMDPVTGIGNWTEEQFVRAVRDGFTPDNHALRYPMERLPELTPEEVGAIYAYLKTVPVLHNPRKQSEGFVLAGTNVSDGQRTYYKYGCTSCHGETGVGSCDLTHAHENYKTNDVLIAHIKNEGSFVENSKMPTWQGIIPENEYEALATYVRLLGERAAKSRGTISMR